MESRGVYIQEQFDKAIQSLEAKIEELASRPEIEFAAIKEAYVNHPIPSGGFLLTSQQEEVRFPREKSLNFHFVNFLQFE